MKLRLLTHASLFALVCPIHLFCQTESQSLTLELKTHERTPVPSIPATGGIDPIRCDASGNIYMRPAASGKTSFLGGPILRIAPDGQRTTSFELSIPELKDAKRVNIQDYAVSSTGQVFELVSFQTKDSHPAAGVVAFDEDGHPSGFTPINVSFSPRQIALFQSGQQLLSGIWYDSAEPVAQDKKITNQPYTAIFNKNGQLVKEVKLPDDVSFEGRPDDPAKEETPFSRAQHSIDLSRSLTGPDGNVYLFRSGRKPAVYVISMGGEVIRKMTVPLPPNEDNSPSMFLAAGKLAFDIFQPTAPNSPNMRMTILVIDAQTGEKLWDYLPAPDLFGIPACYNGREFVFLSATADHHLALLHASP
jgi:hypothetical protein